MVRRLALIFLSIVCITACSSADDGIDNTPPIDEQEDDGGDGGDGGDEGDDDGETILFSELILQDEFISLGFEAQLELAVAQTPEGGTLQLPAGEYQITKAVNINKSITLQGVGVTPTRERTETTTAKELAGSGEIETRLIVNGTLSNGIYINCDNTTLRHLHIAGSIEYSGSSYSLTNLVRFGAVIDNFKTENVFMGNANYILSTRDVMVTSIDCRYTTFYKSYNRCFFQNRGYLDEPGGDLTHIDKMVFYRCAFSVADASKQDTRGIALDSGNNENPNILDFCSSEIRECYFDGNGYGTSKGQNTQIIDCQFDVHENFFGYAIHLEEYANNIYISGNTFYPQGECPRAMMGVLNNATIENNKVVGKCLGFIQGRYAYNLNIRNNDLSQMEASSSSNFIAVSLWDTKAGCRDVTVTGNTFGAGQTIKVCAKSEYSSTIDVSSNTGGTGGYTEVMGYVFPFEEGAQCRIKNLETGLYLRATATEGYIELSQSSDDATLWSLSQYFPNRYNVKSVKYDSYLYIIDGTEGESDDGSSASYAPETKSFSSAERKPIWDLSYTEDSAGGNIIAPGGDNASVLEVYNNNSLIRAITDSGRDNAEITVSDPLRLWVFEVVN